MSNMNNPLTIQLADHAGLTWAQAQLTQFHYLHHPVDVRCSPVAYLVLDQDARRMGCLIFGRPQASRVGGWYGSVEVQRADRCPLTFWQIVNLARVWLDPVVQHGGACYVPNAATHIMAQALRRIGYDYLMHHPPCFLNEAYEIRECLSYNDLTHHQGTLYRVANFRLVRENARGIQTYAIPLRHMTHAERHAIEKRADESLRSRRYRSRQVTACYTQEVMFSIE